MGVVIFSELEKVEIKDTDEPFKIPYKYYIWQDFLNFLIITVLLLIPAFFFIIYHLIKPLGFVNLLFYITFFVVFGLYISMISFYRVGALDPSFKFYRKFSTYYLRRYIMKNIKCPKCQGSLSEYEPLSPLAKFYWDYAYICSKCGASFKLYTNSYGEIRPLLLLRKVNVEKEWKKVEEEISKKGLTLEQYEKAKRKGALGIFHLTITLIITGLLIYKPISKLEVLAPYLIAFIYASITGSYFLFGMWKILRRESKIR